MNYISVNGKRIELTEEQVRQIVDAHIKDQIQLSEVPAGEIVRIGEYEFIVLEQMDTETAGILKDLLEEEISFGSGNHYKDSNVDKACCKFAPLIAAIIGDDNLVDHKVDLTADDGLEDYGMITRRVSSLTANQYRRYVEILDQHKPDSWWWLATPFSTKRHDNDVWVKCVSPSGCINRNRYNDVLGVRPFCIFKSSIFESFEE